MDERRVTEQLVRNEPFMVHAAALKQLSANDEVSVLEDGGDAGAERSGAKEQFDDAEDGL